MGLIVNHLAWVGTFRIEGREAKDGLILLHESVPVGMSGGESLKSRKNECDS